MNRHRIKSHVTASNRTGHSHLAHRDLTAPILTVLLVFMVMVFFPAGAVAVETPPLLWNACETGEGVGQCSIPRGIAAEPVLPGHLYVADQHNNRVDEFTAWGEFLKAWGWGVTNGEDALQTCGPAATPPTVNCQKGIEGSGAGQFHEGVQGIALDSKGDVYVVDLDNHRVQKFDPEGHFLLMFGGGVDQGPHHPGDLCTAVYIAEGDTCGAGSIGMADGQFSADWSVGSYIAVGPGDKVYVGDKGRIEEFNSGGEFTGKIEGGVLAGKRVQSLAVDSAGNPYVAFCKTPSGLCEEFNDTEPDVSKLDPVTGAVVCTLAVKEPTAIATDSAGNIYVVDSEFESLGPRERSRVREFGSNCVEEGMPFGEGELEGVTGIAAGRACLSQGADLYVANFKYTNSFVRAYGPSPDNPGCPPPPNPPEIDDQYAVSVGSGGAVLKAEINPVFWADTRYFVQYGIGRCSEGGCTKEQPVSPGSLLTFKVISRPLTTTGVFLGGLEPHTTYHYRFVAGSTGGGPVFGVGGKVGLDGTEASFTTPQPVPPETDCPSNQVFRKGFSAALPDCRAYEMVSPVDKANGSVIELCAESCSATAGLDQSALAGGKITYSSYRAFGDAKSSPLGVQYLASRGIGGWSSESISPPPTVAPPVHEGVLLDAPFKAFSPDLCQGWLAYLSEPPLDSLAPPGPINLYNHGYCGGGAGGYEALIRAERHGVVLLPELQGVSAESSCAIFRVNDNLTTEAPVLPEERQLYGNCDGTLRLISVLPDGVPNEIASSAGSAVSSGFNNGRETAVNHALSSDGSRVYWSTAPTIGDGGKGLGVLYLRVNAGREQSEVVDGECTEPAKACTLPVSETVSGLAAQFWTAASDGSRAIFSIGEDLYDFDAEEDDSTLIAHKVKGVVGASEDVSRVYLVSEEALAGGATGGEPNLYLYEGGGFVFVATLSGADVARQLSLTAASPRFHTARVSPDGGSVAFMSASKGLSEQTAGYDNTDLNSGQADAEVYLYDAAADGGQGRLRCVSCDPTGARPVGAPYHLGGEEREEFPVAASIPTWETELYDPRALSANGARLFFDSAGPLVPEDTNSAQDVYEWEAAGEGGCSEEEATFSPVSGGCLRLISSGQNPSASEFLDADETGGDVFFKTAASLLPQDPGLTDIYDARVGGGFPPSREALAVCEGEACQGSPVAPDDSTPASAVFSGPGNLVSTLTTTVTTTATAKKKTTAAQMRAQQLSRALKACRTKARSRRKSCEAAARKKYAVAKKTKKAEKAKETVKRSTRGGR